MTRSKKRVIVIILCAALALFCAELGREYVTYRVNSNKLEGGYWRINGRTGMTKEQVREVIGEPDVVLPGNMEENWYWDAGIHKGLLLRLVYPGKAYVLNARFDNEGRMIDVYSETSIVTR